MFELWLISIADSVKNLFIGLTVPLTIAGLFFLGSKIFIWLNPPSSEEEQVRAKKANKCFKVTLIALFISAFISILIPKSKDLYIIIGGGMVLDFFQENPEAQKLPENILENINYWLESYQDQDNDSIK